MLAVDSVLIATTALGSTLILTPAVRHFAIRHHLVDKPDSHTKEARKIHSTATPILGGVPIVVGVFLSLAIWGNLTALVHIFVASLILFFVGLIDDIRPLSARLRLVIQIITASYTVLAADIIPSTLSLTASYSFSIPWIFGFGLALFIVVGAINCMNMIDGLDGLAGGVAFIGFAMLSYLHFLTTRDIDILVFFALPILAALLGFLKFNTHPASIFMGDAGSNWIGLMVGVFMLMTLNGSTILFPAEGTKTILQSATGMSTASLPLAAVLLCFAVPIFDTATVIYRRMRSGKSPFFPDKQHIHHLLLAHGFSHSESVTAIYFISLALGILGVIPQAFKSVDLSTISWVSFFGSLVFFIAIPSLPGSTFLRIARTSREGVSSPHSTKIIGLWETLNRYTLYGIVALLPFFANVPSQPLGIAAVILAPIIGILAFIPLKGIDFLQHFAMILAISLLLVVLNQHPFQVEILGEVLNAQSVYNFVFVWLGCNVLIHMTLTWRRRYLIISSSDFLLVTIPLLFFLVPEPWASQYHLSTIGLRAFVLFGAMRTLVQGHEHVFRRLKILISFSLLFLAGVSLLGIRIVY